MQVTARSLLFSFLFISTLLVRAAAQDATLPADAPRIEFFSPQGYMKQVRQVTVRFSANMVALGDPRLADPFDIRCDAKGKGRWADTRNWVYDFDEDLPAGIRCIFTPKNGLKSVAGKAIVDAREYSFETGGPAIVASLPHEGWYGVDENQVFVLKLDAPATVESVKTNAYCSIEGVAERIPVEILGGSERAAVLSQRKLMGYDYLRLFWKNGAESDVRVRNRNMEQDDALITLLRCKRSLPPATRMQVHWGAGIATASGIATQTEQTLAFKVRAAFTAQVECTRTNAQSGCIPSLPITVQFSTQVPRKLAEGIQLRTSGGHVYAPQFPQSSDNPFVDSVAFNPPFPDGEPVTVSLPSGLVDDAGRSLQNASRFPLQVRVDPYPPLVKFAGTFGILEAKEGGVLPVTLRNVEPALKTTEVALPGKTLRIDGDPAVIAEWLQRVERAEALKGEWVREEKKKAGEPRAKMEDEDDDTQDEDTQEIWHDNTGIAPVFTDNDNTTAFTLKKALGQKPAEVMGIPLGKPGFYVVQVESKLLGASLLGRDATRYVSTSALVTNMAVHFKWGRESSRVWVTHLDDGSVVPDAEVAIAEYCGGQVLWQGATDHDGIAVINQSFGEPTESDSCNFWGRKPLLVVAKKADDFSFTQSGWNQGITPQQFSMPVGGTYSIAIVHTVLDRSLFSAGETVSMKHFLRKHYLQGIAVMDGASGTHQMIIRHNGSGTEYKQDVQIGADGIGESRWTIPKEAKLGDYTVNIDNRITAQFKVEQFRLPSMHASVSGSAIPLVQPKQVSVDLHVAYLSGGGASGLSVKLRTALEPGVQTFSDYPDYQFGGEPVKEGIVTGVPGYFDYDFEGEPGTAAKEKTSVIPVTLDGNGSARVTIPDVPAVEQTSQLTAELEYPDANGELLTTSGRIQLVPSSLNVGVRTEGWVASADQARFRVLVLDLHGKPRAQQQVDVSMYQVKQYSYRKRLIGGFYTYETTRDTRKLSTTCSGRTDAQGLLLCDVKPGVSGQVLLRAETRDDQGKIAGATSSVWVAGKDSWWFGGTSGDRMDVLPEKKEYEAGDTAHFQVRMPFRSATALVTVEREGVLSSFVKHLDGHEPVIDVPVTAQYSPNVFVSVLAVRGRVAHAEQSKSAADEITALVDLNKPAYRLGMTQIKVGWKPHRLSVKVMPAQSTYKVRDKAVVKIHVERADGGALPADSEVAVAAVDEALLDLMPNNTWNLLDAMMGARGLEVWTSTAQMQVIGKRHYGQKAVAPGGGGGRERDRGRELFNTLLLWKGRVTLDVNGDATVNVPLNDSLSAFRIVAVADGGAGFFGTGSADINTTQDVILLSGLPPLVREGDQYAATFTVRNTTDHVMTVKAEAKLVPAGSESLPLQMLTIPAGQSRDAVWQLTAPVNTASLVWDVTASDVNGNARDHMKVTEKVIPAFPVRTYQATIAQLTSPLSMPVAQPRGSISGRGGIEVTLRAKLGDGLDGVREFMMRYPYICLEQLASRAVALRDEGDWNALMARLPAYMDGDGLLKYFATDRLEGDDTLTSYILAIANESGWHVNDIDRNQMIHALTRFVEGKLIRGSALPTADLSIRKLIAIEALSRYHAAEPHMLDSITIEPNLWPTSEVLDWINILERMDNIPQRDSKLDNALSILRSRLNFQGTIMTFSGEHSDALWWLMISADSNANRMLLAVLNRPEWREDIPRLVRGALGRQQFGHWNTTVANAWGVLAMEKFSATFEATDVAGATTTQYGSVQRITEWPQREHATEIKLPWQPAQANVTITHAGEGAPWAMVRATAALPLDKPLSTGFKVTRTVTAVDQHKPGEWTRGDVVRIHLDLEAQSDMSWVVIDDPIPAGSTVLGSGLGGQSELLRDEHRTGWAWLAFEERRFDGYRAYYRFVPKGKWSVEYTVRLNNPGTFLQPATRVEAMYAPEMFGELPNAAVKVLPLVP
ncbi:MAG TPA: MG2 domain-containing protein [Steroidobacteraceae bacterium]|nr:MG2 domain-containing protein [Steroidobacteraceae bacterium]